MQLYYYEVTEDNRLLGKTSNFSLSNMDSSEVKEERDYYASKSKLPHHARFELKEVQK